MICKAKYTRTTTIVRRITNEFIYTVFYLLNFMLRNFWNSRIYISILWLQPRSRGCNFDDKGFVLSVKYSDSNVIYFIFERDIPCKIKRLNALIARQLATKVSSQI